MVEKRGVGIHYRTDGLTPDKFQDWCFVNIGLPQTVQPNILICGDHTRGVFFSYVPEKDKLRIGVFGEMTEAEGWDAINVWAERIARECQINLEAIERDLFEGGVCVGHWLLPLAPAPDKPVVPSLPRKKKEWAH